MWEPYNNGNIVLSFYHRNGLPFNGTMEEFFSEHGIPAGFKNKYTGMIIVINQYGEIAARGAQIIGA